MQPLFATIFLCRDIVKRKRCAINFNICGNQRTLRSLNTVILTSTEVPTGATKTPRINTKTFVSVLHILHSPKLEPRAWFASQDAHKRLPSRYPSAQNAILFSTLISLNVF